MNPTTSEQASAASRIIHDVATLIYTGQKIQQSGVAGKKLIEELSEINFTIRDIESAEYAEHRKLTSDFGDLAHLHKLLTLLKALYQKQSKEAILQTEIRLIQASACLLLDYNTVLKPATAVVLAKPQTRSTDSEHWDRLRSDLHLLCWCIGTLLSVPHGKRVEGPVLAELNNMKKVALLLEAAFQSRDLVKVKIHLRELKEALERVRTDNEHTATKDLMKDHVPQYNASEFLSVEATLATIVKLVMERQRVMTTRTSALNVISAVVDPCSQPLKNVAVGDPHNFQSAVQEATQNQTPNVRDRDMVQRSQELRFALGKLQDNYRKEISGDRKFNPDELHMVEDIVIGLSIVRLTETSRAFLDGKIMHRSHLPIPPNLSVGSEVLPLGTFHHDVLTLEFIMERTDAMRLGKESEAWIAKTRALAKAFLKNCKESLEIKHLVDGPSIDIYVALFSSVQRDVEKMEKFYVPPTPLKW